MKNRSYPRIIGPGIILLLIIVPVSPVLAAAPEQPSSADNRIAANTVNISRGVCDLFGIECDEATMAKGVYIDNDMGNFSPQWTLIMLGSTKYRENVSSFIDGLDVPKEQKAGWQSTLESLWEQYPVRAVKTEIGLALTIVPEKSGAQLASSEEAALREFADEIGRGMAASLDGGSGVRWMGEVHSGVIKAACTHNSVDDTDAGIAGSVALAPDSWPYSGQIERSYHHGYLPPFFPPPPGIPVGYGGAPENCQKNATDAVMDYYNNQLTDVFESLGHSSHFMTDVGNPMHTGAAFVQGTLDAMGWMVHHAYENYTDNNWDTLGFNETVNDTVDVEVYATPDSSTRLLGWKTHLYCDTLVTLVTANYIAHDGEFHLEEDSTIAYITEYSLVETTKHTNGLVYWLTNLAPQRHTVMFNMQIGSLAWYYASHPIARGELSGGDQWVWNFYLFGQDSSGLNGRLQVYGTNPSTDQVIALS